MSEGVGEARPEAEGELALARLALDAGELAHAAEHAGNAVAADPPLRAAYQLLDELPAATADADALFPVEGTPHIGTVAARSYLTAHLVLITPGMPADAADVARTVIERESAEDERAAGARSGRRLFRRRSREG